MPYANPYMYRAKLASFYPRKYGGSGYIRKRSRYGYTSKTAKAKTVATYSKPVVNPSNFGISQRAGLGTKKTVIMPYYSTLQITTGATGTVTKILDFAANGAFQPDLSGGGHQPLMFDQMTSIFERYRVMKCTYRIQIHPNANNTINYVIGVNDAGAPAASIANFEMVVENGMSQQKFNSSTNPIIFTGIIDCSKVDGLTKSEYVSRTGDFFNSNPSDVIHLFGFAHNIAGTATNVNVSVYLEFEVECEGTRVTTQS